MSLWLINYNLYDENIPHEDQNIYDKIRKTFVAYKRSGIKFLNIQSPFTQITKWFLKKEKEVTNMFAREK